MDGFNLNLYLMWVLSIVPMMAIAFYGFFKCKMCVFDFIIVSIVAVIPVINTIILVLLILFSCTGALKRNGSNQY